MITALKLMARPGGATSREITEVTKQGSGDHAKLQLWRLASSRETRVWRVTEKGIAFLPACLSGDTECAQPCARKKGIN